MAHLDEDKRAFSGNDAVEQRSPESFVDEGAGAASSAREVRDVQVEEVVHVVAPSKESVGIGVAIGR